MKFFRGRNFSLNVRDSTLVAKSTLMGASGMGNEYRNDEGLFAGYWILDTGFWFLDTGFSMLDNESSLYKINLCR